MDRLNVGVIGCGSMGRSLVKASEPLESVRISAVSDLNEEAAQELAKSTGAKVFTDYREMFDSGGLDAVIVASPPFLHCEMTVAAAEAGLHVFCEKPMSTNKADCVKMIEACEGAGVKLMIGQVCRYHAVHSKVKELVASGELGPPVCMVVRRLSGGYGGAFKVPWRLTRAKSGGALMEINAHEIDFMRWVCGDVASVFATGPRTADSNVDYPNPVLLSMQFKSGAIGLLHSSHMSRVGAYGGRVDCEKGGLDFPSIWGEGAGITVASADGASRFIAAADIKVETPTTHELRAFADAVREDKEPEVTGRDGMAAVEIAEAAYRSIEMQQPVALPI